MTALDRRRMLRLAAVGALLPTLTSVSAGAAAASPFAPPARPMLYSRRLRRVMVDGSAFTVERSFSIRFVAAGAGYRVEGEQVAVNVEAPERLARFAELERAKREEALFPLMLDAGGLIAGAGAPIDSGQLDTAVREAMKEMAAAGLGADDKAEAARFFASLNRNLGQVLAELPRDLFAPRETAREATHGVPLPGGGAGAVSVRFTARTDPATGLMREAERQVLTELAGDRRTTVESWSLTPL